VQQSSCYRNSYTCIVATVAAAVAAFVATVAAVVAAAVAGMVVAGMKDLFVDGVADLSGVDGTKQLSVSKVLHRAVVDVNEEGTEAAAATAVVMVLESFSEPKVFRADHPFVFFIQDKATRSILFLGRLVKPPASA